ncbi:MAG: phosphatidylserine decarboxylase family protein [Bacteroidota bacterium]
MTLHKEGKASLLLTGLFCIIVGLITWFYISQPYSYILYAGLAVLFLLILQFFRNPSIIISKDPSKVYAPADGKVVVIEETTENEFLNEERIQVSIFMSPVNVHVNRNPIGGVISYFKYHPGKYLVAWHPKSSTENERTTIVYKNENGSQILIRQIAGALARRIKWYVQEGDAVEQGNEFGFIKFGSRVDLFLPKSAKIMVDIDQKTKGGRTVIAEL